MPHHSTRKRSALGLQSAPRGVNITSHLLESDIAKIVTVELVMRVNYISRFLFSLSIALPLLASLACAADSVPKTFPLSPELRARCLEILRTGLKSGEFWPAMHAAEALTLAGYPAEVRSALEPLLSTEKDDQRRCGLSRELVRAGDRSKVKVMLEILAKSDVYGHTHAAESLFKVGEIGDGVLLRKTFTESKDVKRQLMAAAALARSGDKSALAFVRQKLASEDVESRRIAAWVLARLGDAADIPLLRKNAERDQADPKPHMYAICALASLGDASSIPALEKNFNNSDIEIRTFAADFAGVAHATQLGDRLIHLLADPVFDVRIRAAQSLFALSAPPEDKWLKK